jgi:hypothetical protein
MKKRQPPIGPSYSDDYLNNRNGVPQVSALMAQGVSHIRKEALASEVGRGLYKDGTGPSFTETGLTQNSNVTSLVGFNRTAQVTSGGGNLGAGYSAGGGDSVKQIPEVYSPLWLSSNLNLPRDRATINAWCRAFYALNPFVHNAIQLHSTYPISKLSIKCPNPDIQKFFDDMIEELDLMNICVQIAQEYWLLGEAFVYAELDVNKGKWSRLMIQNPDYMIVKRTVIANEPLIMLRPDENLKRIVNSNRPADIEQRKQLNQHIIDSVKRGENIPLDNFSCTHLARKISPYEIRGTGLPVCIFRQLMLFDKLRECFDKDTEVYTNKGFKKITDLVYQNTNINPDPNFVNGVFVDQNSEVASILTMKEDFKVGCVNPETNEIEYHKPIELHMSQYNGKMLHFTGKHVDTLVTPNHKMWAKKRKNNQYGEFQFIKASEFTDKGLYKFSAKVDWIGDRIETINILGYDVPSDVYLKFIGYVISEGCVDTSKNEKTGQFRYRTSISQLTESPYYNEMRDNIEKFSAIMEHHVGHDVKIRGSGFSKDTPKEMWIGTISSKELNGYLFDQIGINGKCNSFNKRIPRWILSLHKDHLLILLKSLVDGDGSRKEIDNNLISYRYTTVSQQLADDVQELALKCGYSSFISKDKRPEKSTYEYTVRWSDSEIGSEPTICNSDTQRVAKIKEIDYNGVVWCFEVPTGLFITRRNNRISIHGNSKYAQADNMINPLTLVKIGNDGPEGLHPTFSDLEAWRQVFEEAQYDKDFKIFTHPGVSVERVGYGSGIYDISGDITQLVKEIYVGLQVPPVLMDGGADTTYANGGVALDVLRQRYMQFRNMMGIFLKRKIFAPISRIQGFYNTIEGKKQLIVPDIDWNHMSLFDAGDYISTLVTLTTSTGDQGPPPRASLHTLYRSMGLEWEDEQRKLREEAIVGEILKKEQASLKAMPLTELRALDKDEDIPELAAQPGQQDSGAPVPGEVSSGGIPPDMNISPSGGLPGLSAPPGGLGAPASPEASPSPPAGSAGSPPPVAPTK